MNKQEVREKAKQKRKTEDIEALSFEIARKLLTLPEFLSADKIFCYYSVGDEISTLGIIDVSLSMNKTVCLPKTKEDYSLEFFEYRGGLQMGRFHIPEPTSEKRADSTEKSVCIVPCLAVNKQFHRVGYGKGCYDRFLKDFKGIKIGLSLYLEDFEAEETDISLDKVIFPY